MVHLGEALCYKLEGHRFDSQWCSWNFSLTYPFQPLYGPGVDSVCNRNEYQEYFLGGIDGWCRGLTALPPLCADCLEICQSQPPGTLWACDRPVQGLLFFLLEYHFYHFSLSNFFVHVKYSYVIVRCNFIFINLKL